MADIRFTCDACQHSVVADASASGSEIRCPGCQKPLIVPAPSLPQPDAAHADELPPVSQAGPAPTPQPAAELPQIEGYEILAKLGEGGMGAVYRARQPMLNRVVALKVMSRRYSDDPSFVARFIREAAAAANLSHRNMVQVFTAGESNGIRFIAMEFVEGRTLSEHIRKHGRLDAREAVAVAIYVAQALQYAWNKARLIHRDIKPENVFLSYGGEVKVGDLGLAKSVGETEAALTTTGVTVGSPHYISPEQARAAKDMDFRADIYSLGCTLFHMLTGRPPFDAEDILSIMMKHVSEAPPVISEIWPECPASLAALLDRMLAKDRAARPASYEDLVEELMVIHDELKSSSKPSPISPIEPTKSFVAKTVPALRRKPQVMVGAIVAVAATVVTFAGLWLWSSWKNTTTLEVIQPSVAEAKQSLPTATTDMPNMRLLAKTKDITISTVQFVEADISSVVLYLNDSIWGSEKQKNNPDAVKVVLALSDAERERVRPITLKLQNASLYEVLSFIGSIAKLQFRMEDNDIVLTADNNTQINLKQSSSVQPVVQIAAPASATVQASVAMPLPRPVEMPTAAISPAANTAGAAITISCSEAVRILPLEVGQTRLRNTQRLWLIESVSPELLGWQFVSITQHKINAYEIRVNQHAVLYAFGGGKKKDLTVQEFLGANDLSKWESVAGAIRDKENAVKFCLRRKVAVGEIIKLRGFELQIAARSIELTDGRKPQSVTPTAVSSSSPAVQSSQPWTNSLGMEFVPVPGTKVQFCIWETRVQDFSVFVTATDYDATSGVYSMRSDGWKLVGDTWKSPDLAPAPTYPVVGMSWDDANAFCKWLTDKERREGRLAAGQSYRLPTDAEWSVAVGLPPETGSAPKEKGSKTKNVYPWGSQWPPPSGTGNFAGEEAKNTNWKSGFSVIYGYNDGYPRTSPVGSFKPNQFGLYDLSGNAWEWCEDWYDDEKKCRVVRGGSWGSRDPETLFSSHRRDSVPDRRYDYLGFRVVLEGEAPAAPAPAHLPLAPATVPAPARVQASKLPLLPVALLAAQARTTQSWTNSLGMKFVSVPGTKVLFSIWDTRVQDYQAFVTTTGRAWDGNPAFRREPTCPAVFLDWNDAKAFCGWLTGKERRAGMLTSAQEYRLPTDLEWSTAVGLENEAGSTPKDRNKGIRDVYPWGSQWPPPRGAGNYDQKLNVDDFKATSPVGSFKPNQFGLYDMMGNVYQWCEDFWEGSSGDHVLRGCGFQAHLADEMLSSRRVHRDHGDCFRGFRCVLAGGAVSVPQAQSGVASTPASSPAPISTVLAPRPSVQPRVASAVAGSPALVSLANTTAWITPTLPKADSNGWITLFDEKKLYGCRPTSQVFASGQVYFKDGYLYVNDAWFSFDWKGQNATIRARVKKINGKHVALHIGPCFAWYGNGFGISQKVSDRDRAPILISRKLISRTTGFVDLEFSMTGRQLEFKFNGAVVLTTQARPFENNEKSVQVSTWQGLSQFERIEVKQ